MAKDLPFFYCVFFGSDVDLVVGVTDVSAYSAVIGVCQSVILGDGEVALIFDANTLL